jgi:hypothetical protein
MINLIRLNCLQIIQAALRQTRPIIDESQVVTFRTQNRFERFCEEVRRRFGVPVSDEKMAECFKIHNNQPKIGEIADLLTQEYR